MTPDGDFQRLLQRYHATPGRTAAILQAWTDDAGRTSYEVLAERMHGLARDARVLDLGCGDGFLLQMLAERGFLHLVGVDTSREELDAARERLGSTAQLHCQDARAIGFPDHSIDVVVSHMALMLMPSVPSVLTEVARVLVPGGRFIAIINRALRDPAYEVYRQALYRITADSGIEPIQLDEPRVFTVEGLSELLKGASFADKELVDFRIRIHDTPSEVWSRLRMMYDVYRLPESAQLAMERQALDGWRPLSDDSGQLTCALGMRLIDGRSAGRES